MNLKEFITNALTDIAQGVQDAINESAGKGYLVNPSTKEGHTHTVHFDLAVETEKSGNADIKILTGAVSERNVSRLSFDVDMTFPSPDGRKGPKRPVLDNP